jgi:hypothetical protein
MGMGKHTSWYACRTYKQAVTFILNLTFAGIFGLLTIRASTRISSTIVTNPKIRKVRTPPSINMSTEMRQGLFGTVQYRL